MKIQNVPVGTGLPKILGVLNISPESFFTDSFTPTNQILRRVEQMKRDGADIIDLGARSTALNAPPLSVSEEKERVVMALRELDDPGIPLSLDTMHTAVLESALHYDISAVNDISGLLDPEFVKTAADSCLPVISMASHERPGDAVNFSATCRAITEVLGRAEKYDVSDRLILDPGIGKWTAERSTEADWELCRRFGELKKFGHPLLAAVSRKAFIGDILNKSPQERLYGTLTVQFALLDKGADLLRVHDVGAARDLITVFHTLRR